MATDYSFFRAHPTRYKGTLFRSRLEARWAAFFDQLGWRWQYEPFDLHGWVPDFLIEGAQSALVEVKPILAIDKDVANKMEKATGRKCRLIICGLYPIIGDCTVNLHSNCGCDDSRCSWRQRAILKIDGCFDMAFGHHPYPCFVTGLDALEHPVDEFLIDEIEPLWAKAGNAVQWHPKA